MTPLPVRGKPAGARRRLRPKIEAIPRLGADNGDAVLDWALAGCGVAS